MSDTSLDRIPKRHPHAGFRIFEGQAMVIMPDGSYIHVLNEIGSRVWELMDGERSESQIVEILCQEFETDPAEVAKDVKDFLATLEAHRMLGGSEQGRKGTTP